MRLTNWRNMDVHLLVGLVNTALRNDCDSLDDLLKTHDIPEEDFLRKMRDGGYEYREEQGQFRGV